MRNLYKKIKIVKVLNEIPYVYITSTNLIIIVRISVLS